MRTSISLWTLICLAWFSILPFLISLMATSSPHLISNQGNIEKYQLGNSPNSEHHVSCINSHAPLGMDPKLDLPKLPLTECMEELVVSKEDLRPTRVGVLSRVEGDIDRLAVPGHDRDDLVGGTVPVSWSWVGSRGDGSRDRDQWL